MNFKFENQGTATFLVYEVSENDNLDSMSLGMITNNKIPGIAACVLTQMNEQKFIKYNVSAKVAVSQFFSGAVNKKRLIGVFNGITDALLSAEEYMIDPGMLILDTEYIYTDVSTCETVMVCLPLAGGEKGNIDPGGFFKQIMFTTQFDQTENCDYVARIINYLNSAPVFSPVDFKKVITELRNGTGNAFREPSSKPEQMPELRSAVKKPVVSQPLGKRNNPAGAPAARPQPAAVHPPVNQFAGQPQAAYAVPPVQRPGGSPPQNPVAAGVRGGHMGMNVPPAAKAPAKNPAAPQGKMSLFYLLQHYNKENAALYKAQKNEKKGKAAPSYENGGAYKVPGAYPNRPAKQQNPQGANPGFAIPGQNVPLPGNAYERRTPQTVPQLVQPQPPVKAQRMQGIPKNFGDTTILISGTTGETTVLNGMNTPSQGTVTAILIRLKNNERIPLQKPVFRIGKERSYVDYFIADNAAISRSHANIINREGKYFIVDTNSTNHTYVNGSMIQSGGEIPLENGDRIRLANEDFDFKIG